MSVFPRVPVALSGVFTNLYPVTLFSSVVYVSPSFRVCTTSSVIFSLLLFTSTYSAVTLLNFLYSYVRVIRFSPITPVGFSGDLTNSYPGMFFSVAV